MTFATDMRAMADELATEFGNAATFKDKTTNTYDETTGTVTLATTDRSVTVAGPFGIDPRLVNGDTVQDRDATIILSAEGLTWSPDVGETVVIDSKTWAVVGITPYTAQDTTVAWELHIR